MDGTTVIKIDYYNELKDKADKWDELNETLSYEARVGRATMKVLGQYLFDDIDELLRIADGED